MLKQILSIGLLGLSALPGTAAQLPASSEVAERALAALAPTGLAFVSEDELRDVPSAELPFSGFAPPKRVDLAAHMPAPGFQGRQNSCVAWVSAYAVKTYQEKLEQRYTLTQSGQPDMRRIFSPAFVYNQINQGRDGGATLVDALRLLSGRGALPWAEMPYEIENFTRQPSGDQLKAARRYRIATWRQVNVKDTAELKAHLLAGYPIMVGAMVDESLYRLRPGAVWKRSGGKSLGGHAMVVVGYDEQREAFKIMNSWGSTWADRGYGWISYGQFKKVMREGYIAKDAINDSAPDLVRNDPGAPSVHRPLSTRTPERDKAGAELKHDQDASGDQASSVQRGYTVANEANLDRDPASSGGTPTPVMRPAQVQTPADTRNLNDSEPELYFQQEEIRILPLSLRRHEIFAGDLVLSGNALLDGLDGREARVVVRFYRDAAASESLAANNPALALPDGSAVAVSPELAVSGDQLEWKARIPLESLPKDLEAVWVRPVLYLDGFGVESGDVTRIRLQD